MQTNWIRTLVLTSFIVVTLTSCAPAITPTQLTPLQAASPIETSAPLETSTLTVAVPPTLTETATSSPTKAPTPTETSAPAITPTFAILRGQVLETSNCRYGPGAPYLYFTGLVTGSNLEVIGRREDSQWIYVQAIGGHHPCWVKASQINVKGDINRLEIYYPRLAPLPQSPYYPPTTIRSATRNGNQVTVEWRDIPVSAGDYEDENMQQYIIEVWRCEAGQMIFDPLGTNDTSITFVDEPGCSQPSHGRIFVQEKHGFAGPTEIPWPPQK